MITRLYRRIRRRKARWGALAAVLVCGALPAAGQDADAAGAVDSAAIAALDRMGAYLRTLKAFRVSGAIQQEHVLESGLKVQFAENVSLCARPPDRLLATVSSDMKERVFFYDGKQFTLWAPLMNFYATVDAPSTIHELIEALDAKFNIEMPLRDLFLWDSSAGSAAAIEAAVDIGSGRVGHVDCRHYVLRGDGVDWQIWIQEGEYPLPRKLVLTTTTDEARPQYQAIYAWDLAPSFVETDFTFQPPSHAQMIALKQTTPAIDEPKEEN